MLQKKQSALTSIMKEAKEVFNTAPEDISDNFKKVKEIPYEKLIASPFNEGLELESLEGLVRSMKKEGFVGAIVVYDLSKIPGKEGMYEICSGHTSVEAWCVRLHHKTIPAIVYNYPDDIMDRFLQHKSMNENTRTKNSNFWAVEIKNAETVLIEQGFDGNVEEKMTLIAKMLGLNKSSVYRHIAVNKLIPPLRNLEGKKVSTTALYEASTLNETQQQELADCINAQTEASEMISKPEIKKMVNKIKASSAESNEKQQKKPKRSRSKSYLDQFYDSMSPYNTLIKNIDYEYITNNNLNEEIIGALESVIKKTQEIINELR